MNYIFGVVIISFPLIAFLAAGFIELRSERNSMQKTLSCFPVLLGIFAYVLSSGPAVLPRFPEITSANWITFLCAIVASSGAMIPYARRLSSGLVALGGLDLVFIGIFFSKPIV